MNVPDGQYSQFGLQSISGRQELFNRIKPLKQEKHIDNVPLRQGNIQVSSQINGLSVEFYLTKEYPYLHTEQLPLKH
jgi:hypothetical protein